MASNDNGGHRRPAPPTAWEQTQTLLRKSYLLKRGAWKMTALELFIPLYPLFFLYFILKLDFIPYKLFEVDPQTYPAMPLSYGARNMASENVPTGLPAPAVMPGLWRQNLKSLAFSPRNSKTELAVKYMCDTLFADAPIDGGCDKMKDQVSWFANPEDMFTYHDTSSTNATKLIMNQMACAGPDGPGTPAKTDVATAQGSLCAGIVFDTIGTTAGDSTFTVMSNDLTLYTTALTSIQEQAFPGATLPPVTVEEAAEHYGLLFFQAAAADAVAQVVSGGPVAGTNHIASTLRVQKAPVPKQKKVQNFLKYMLPVLFAGALFFNTQATLTQVGTECERGIKQALQLKGMQRMPFWATWFAVASLTGIVSAFLQIAVAYALKVFWYTDAGTLLLLFALFAVAQARRTFTERSRALNPLHVTAMAQDLIVA